MILTDEAFSSFSQKFLRNFLKTFHIYLYEDYKTTTKKTYSQRYELHGGLMLDIWKGNLYVMPNNKEDEKKPMDQRKKQNKEG